MKLVEVFIFEAARAKPLVIQESDFTSVITYGESMEVFGLSGEVRFYRDFDMYENGWMFGVMK